MSERTVSDLVSRKRDLPFGQCSLILDVLLGEQNQ